MKTTRERVLAVLKEIGEIMAIKDEDSLFVDVDAKKKMWDIISCLRGPDSESFELKSKTTARVRAAIGVPDNSYITVSDEGLVNPNEISSTYSLEWELYT